MVHVLNPEESEVEAARAQLLRLSEPLCQDVDETDLPPL